VHKLIDSVDGQTAKCLWKKWIYVRKAAQENIISIETEKQKICLRFALKREASFLNYAQTGCSGGRFFLPRGEKEQNFCARLLMSGLDAAAVAH